MKTSRQASHWSSSMRTNKTIARTNRLAVNWFGRFISGEGGPEAPALLVAMSSSCSDGATEQVVGVGPGDLDAHQVPRVQVLSLDPHEAVNVRGVGVAAAEIVPRRLGIRAVEDH